MNPMDLYEYRTVDDMEFPVQLSVNDHAMRGCYFAPHWHEHIEMHYILEGHTTLMAGQKEILAGKGDLVVINSNELHAGFGDGTHFRARVIIFNLEDFSKELASQNPVFESVIKNDKTVEEIMAVIEKEVKERRESFQLVCKGEIYRLIIQLMRGHVVEKLTDQESEKRKKRLERMNTAVEYIQKNYTRQITNAQLAKMVHSSEDRFNHLFKECIGKAPLQYITELRLKRAMNLIRLKESPISEIALSVGFTDYNSFRRQFIRMYGCSPSKI